MPQQRSSLVIRNVVIDGRRTSVRLNEVMWDAFKDIAQQQHCSVHELATSIAGHREAETLSTAIRAYIIEYYRSLVRRSQGAAAN